MPLLGIIAFFLLVIWRIIASIQHKKTDYFAQTKRTLWDVYCNTGTKGEYLLWKQLRKCLDMENAFVIVISLSPMET